MKILEKKEAYVLKEILCDICNKKCSAGIAKLNAHWGYHSKKDGTVHQAYYCENCFDKIVAFIESIGGKVPEIPGDWIIASPQVRNWIRIDDEKDDTHPLICREPLGEKGVNYEIG